MARKSTRLASIEGVIIYLWRGLPSVTTDQGRRQVLGEIDRALERWLIESDADRVKAIFRRERIQA